MKRIDLVRKLEHGGRHDWYDNPKTGTSQPIPRHRENKDFVAKHILRKLGIE